MKYAREYLSESKEMSDLIHVARPSLLGKNLTFKTTADALSYNDGHREQKIPYSDILSIRSIKYGGFGKGQKLETQKQATIKTRSNGVLKMRSHHFESLGSFHDRSETYDALLRELSKQVASKNPDAEFVQGSRTLFFVWISLLILSIVLALLLSLAILGGAENTLSVLIGIAVSFAMMSFSWRSIKLNRPRSFDISDAPLN